MSESASSETWKIHSPYRIQTPEEFGPVIWQGKCDCGRVTYKLNHEKPLNAKYCHCRGCQVMHGTDTISLNVEHTMGGADFPGAPFQWAAIFHKSDITFSRGAEGLSFYSSGYQTREHVLPTKVSCSFCRSPIMDEGRQVCLIFPESIGHGLSDTDRERWRDAFEVSCHIFYSQRAIDIMDGKPKWSAMDKDSDLLDDSGGLQGL